MVFLMVFSFAEIGSPSLISVAHSALSWLLLAPLLTYFFSAWRLMRRVG